MSWPSVHWQFKMTTQQKETQTLADRGFHAYWRPLLPGLPCALRIRLTHDGIPLLLSLKSLAAMFVHGVYIMIVTLTLKGNEQCPFDLEMPISALTYARLVKPGPLEPDQSESVTATSFSLGTLMDEDWDKVRALLLEFPWPLHGVPGCSLASPHDVTAETFLRLPPCFVSTCADPCWLLFQIISPGLVRLVRMECGTWMKLVSACLSYTLPSLSCKHVFRCIHDYQSHTDALSLLTMESTWSRDPDEKLDIFKNWIYSDA